MDDDLIPIIDKHGQPAWVKRPPPACPNGHPFRPGNRSYRERGWACWCDNAQTAAERPRHTAFMCRTCGAEVVVPPCSDPSQALGWAAHHGQ